MLFETISMSKRLSTSVHHTKIRHLFRMNSEMTKQINLLMEALLTKDSVVPQNTSVDPLVNGQATTCHKLLPTLSTFESLFTPVTSDVGWVIPSRFHSFSTSLTSPRTLGSPFTCPIFLGTDAISMIPCLLVISECARVPE